MGKWYKKWWGILLIFFGTLILIFLTAIGFYILDLVKNIKENKTLGGIIQNRSLSAEEKKTVEGEGNYWLGSPDAKITIVEFADFECPYCQKSFSKIREISLKYRNNVKIIYRDYPLHDNSINLAMASRCAGEQGLFWVMHDKLFQNQGSTSEDNISLFAEQIGADIERFKKCQTEQKYITAIQKDYADGQKLGIRGTPTWFINGYKIEGDIPYSSFINTIEKLIQIK